LWSFAQQKASTQLQNVFAAKECFAKLSVFCNFAFFPLQQNSDLENRLPAESGERVFVASHQKFLIHKKVSRKKFDKKLSVKLDR
jgi:hypothetical protein